MLDWKVNFGYLPIKLWKCSLVAFRQYLIQIIQMIKSSSGLLTSKIIASYSHKLKEPFMRVTSSAVKRLKEIMGDKKDEKLVGVKISLTKKGCSGLGYVMDYIRTDQIRKFDEVLEEQGIKVVVDSKAIMALIGTEMNYVQDEIGSQFVFKNPNEKGKCGCGESFHI